MNFNFDKFSFFLQWGSSGGWITQHPEYVIAQTNGNGKESQIQAATGNGGGIRGGFGKQGGTRGSKTGSTHRTSQRGRQAFQQQSTQAQPIQAQ